MQHNFYQLLKVFDEIIPALSFSLLIAALLSFLHFKIKINRASIFSFFLMCSTFGSVIGMVIGHGDSSEIGSVITAIVTLATSYLTYLASQKIVGEVRFLIPSAVIALMLSLMVSMFYKIEISNNETEFSPEVNKRLKTK